MEKRKSGAMEKTTPSSSSSSSSSEVKVKVEPKMERNSFFKSQSLQQTGQPGVTHIWNDDQPPFSSQVHGLPHPICGFEQPWDTRIWNDDLPGTGGVPGLRHLSICKFEQPWDTFDWDDDLPRTGPVIGRPQHGFYPHDNLSEVQRQMHLDRLRMHQVPPPQPHQQIAQFQPFPTHAFEAPQFLGSTGQVLSRHLDSHAPKQPGAATPIAPDEAHSDDGAVSRKHSQERLSQVGELAAGIATNKMSSTHNVQQQGFSQILEQFSTKFEGGMTKMEELMTKFEEQMATVEKGIAIVPQLVDRISELEKNLENLAGTILKDTGNTTTVVEEKLTNLTISDVKSKEGSTSEQEEEGYTCGEDFVHLLSEE